MHLLIISLTTWSCSYNDNKLSFESNAVKNEIINKIQGNYSSCAASSLYPGYYYLNTAIVSGSSYTYSTTLSSSSTCSTSLNTIRNTYEINDARYIDAALNKEDIQIEFKVKSVKVTFNHNYYVSQNYCGLNDWALNVEKNVTGLSCNDLLSTYDSFHSSFKAIDSLEYVNIKRTPTALWHPTDYAESGDSPSDAYKSLLFEMISY